MDLYDCGVLLALPLPGLTTVVGVGLFGASYTLVFGSLAVGIVASVVVVEGSYRMEKRRRKREQQPEKLNRWVE